MLITFTSKYSPDVLMLGDIASVLLRAMGQSETPPGVLQGENIKSAAEKLRGYLQATPKLEVQLADEDDDEHAQEQERQEQRVGLSIRAQPLLKMLDKAYREQEDVIWR